MKIMEFLQKVLQTRSSQEEVRSIKDDINEESRKTTEKLGQANKVLKKNTDITRIIVREMGLIKN